MRWPTRRSSSGRNGWAADSWSDASWTTRHSSPVTVCQVGLSSTAEPPGAIDRGEDEAPISVAVSGAMLVEEGAHQNVAPTPVAVAAPMFRAVTRTVVSVSGGTRPQASVDAAAMSGDSQNVAPISSGRPPVSIRSTRTSSSEAVTPAAAAVRGSAARPNAAPAPRTRPAFRTSRRAIRPPPSVSVIAATMPQP
ncbi:MAG: hypothetical protein E6J41_25635 [Chloroflexi bacterium]|nr:MAG: hypothetical protein E6J41_25635 [Chloroflexota bacterium]